MFFKKKGKKTSLKIGIPDGKILIVLSYYVVTSIFVLTSFTLITRNYERFTRQLLDYFACEQGGYDLENSVTCDRSTFHQFAHLEVITTGFVLLSLFPTVALVYALNIRMCRQKGNFNVTKNRINGKSTTA